MRIIIGVLSLLALAGDVARGAGSATETGEIAFVREPERRGIWILSSDGTERQLSAEIDYGPDWSPDGRSIAFQRFDGGGSDIYVMRADGSHVRRLTDAGGFFGPDWSPDGRRILLGGFGRSDDGREEIFVMDADGSDLTRVTRSRWTNTRASWSPDGGSIVFASRREGNFDLYVMDSHGRNERRLTTSPARDTSPVWSPDGSLIVFIRHRYGVGQDLYLIRPDGTGLRRLTTNKAVDWAPAWSPDGTRVAFTRSRYKMDRQLIVVIDIRSRMRTRLAISAQYELHPDWRPIGR